MRSPGRHGDRRVRETASAARRPDRRGDVRRAVAGLALCAVALAAPTTRADDPTPDAIARRAAAAHFAEGERAFGAGDFPHAADAFEAAYRAAPHPDALWNAARALHRAGDRARAANLYARYLRTAPPEAPDRNSATSAVRELGLRLGRIDVFAPGATDVRVDDQPLDGPSHYVHPGTHVVRARLGDRTVQHAASVEAGGVVSVALVDEPAAPAPAIAVAPQAKPAPAPTVATAPPIHPAPARPAMVMTVVAGGLTAISAGVLLWSGIDTLDARSAYDALPSGTRTQEVLDAGRAKQDRTNVLVGVTAALGAITTAGAVWLFATEPAPRVGAAPRVRIGLCGAGGAVAGSF